VTDRSLNLYHRLDNLAVDVDTREVTRLLGYPRDAVPLRIIEAMHDVEASAADLICPVAAFRFVDPADRGRSSYLPNTGGVVIAVVSIGEGIEHIAERERSLGRLALAMIFDAFGSAAVEAAADVVESDMASVAAARGVRCSRRFSPGYGGWEVAEQRWILEALRAREIGVTLTEGCMMIPRKSVTFAVTVGENPIEMRDDNICASCGAVDCRWRDTPERCPVRRER